MTFRRLEISFVTLAALICCRETSAQLPQVTVGTPFRSASDSFYESSNIGWSLNGPGFFARFGGGGGVPPFGGFTPNSGINGGFNFGGGGLNGSLNFGFSQGGSRSIVSTTPSVTVMNGYPGFITDSVQRPFVTGLVPVVGAGTVLQNVPAMAPWQAGLARGDFRVEDGRVIPAAGEFPTAAPNERGSERSAPTSRIDALPPTRAERDAALAAEALETQAVAREYLERGQKAAASGKPKVARMYFEMAARRAEGGLLVEIREQLAMIDSGE